MPDAIDERPEIINVRDFSLGLNTKLHPTEIPNGASVLLQNAIISTPGIIKKIKGFKIVANQVDTEDIGGLGYLRSGGRLIRVSDGKVYAWDGASATWGTSIGSIDDSLEPIVIVNGFNNNIGGGADAVYLLGDVTGGVDSWDGTTYQNEPTIPKGKFGAWFQNRLFVAGVAADLHKVHASDILDITVFAAGSAFEIDKGSNGEIIWLHPFRQENLIVLKEDSIHLLNVTGTPPSSAWSVRAVDRENGCGAGRCTITAGSDVIYMDRFGNIRSINQTIRDTEQGTDTLPISDPIEPFIERINKQFIDKCHAVLFGTLYILSVPLDSSTIADTIFIFDIVRRSWTGPIINWSAANMVAADVQTSDEFELYFGTGLATAGKGGKVHQAFTGLTYDGDAIEMVVKTKAFDFGAPMLDKVFSAVEIAVSGADDSLTGGLMRVEAQVDDRDSKVIMTFNTEGTTGLFLSFTLPASLVDIGGIVREQGHLENLGRGRTIQLTITHEFDDGSGILDLSVNLLNVFLHAFIQNYEGEGND